MRKIIYAGLFLLSLNISGQSPALINYQGVVRDANGQPLASQTVALVFQIQSGPPITTVFTETLTSVITNSLGLFSVRIGSSQNLSSVDFSVGSFSLQVLLDPNNGNSFTPMGTAQQLVSVPYALHANNVPATYSNNILTIGNSSFTIGSAGYTPTLTLSGSDNNILGDGTNTVALNTYTVGAGLSMAGGPNYTISSAASNPSIQGTGIAVVTPTSGNSFTVNVPTPSLSSSGNSIILNQGTVVSTATIASQVQSSITATGIATVTSSGTNTFNINVPAPVVSNSGNTITITQGSSTSSLVVPVPPATSVTGTGMAGVTAVGINSFNVNVPTPTLVANSNTLTFTQGTLVSTATVPVQPPTNVTAAGIASVNSTGTNSFNITVPSSSLANSGNSITLTQGTLVTSATVQPQTSVTSSGLGAITSAGTNSFNINVPSPVLSSNNNTITLTQGTVVTTATVFPQGLVTGSGIANVTSAGTNTFNVDVPAPQIAVTTTAGAAGVSSASPASFNINIPPAITPSISGAGIAVVSPTVGNNFTVSVDQPTFAYSQSTGSLTSGTSSAFITPTLVISGGTITSGPTSNSIAINTGTTAMWFTQGNAGTNPTVNFIGTTDNVALQFRVNNIRSGVLDVSQLNTAYGYSSLLSNTSGVENTATGNSSLRSNTTGSFNTADGSQALYSNTNGMENTAIGYRALLANSTGSYNTALGSNVLISNTTASANTALGWGAMRSNSTGSENTASGGLALYFNSSGSNNAAFGTQALFNNSTGSFNVALGHFALFNNTVGTNNVAIGTYAGNNNVTGTGNVFIGSNAGYFETGSNKFYLANSSTSVSPLIYGDFTSGNVSIGTATANHKLNVDGNIALENAAAGAAPGRIIGFPTAASGNHGNLTVQAKSNVFSGIAYVGGNLTLAAGDFNLSGATGPNGGVVTIRAGRNVFDGSGGGDIVFQAGGLTYSERMRITGVNGNVGIGTAPQYRLHVDVSNSPWALALTSSNAGNASVGYRMINNNGVTWQVVNGGTGNGLGFVNGELYLEAAGQRDFLVVNNNSNETFRVTGAGNVGIGNAAPNAPLQFANSIVNRKIVLWEGANNDHQFYGLGINGGTLRYQVDATSADHVFFAGTGAAASNELFRIKGTGTFKMGTETGTFQGPNYPTGGGMVIRRIFTSAQAAGNIVARTDNVQFERDGSNGGFRINRVAGSGLEVCNCMGVNSAGVSVNRAYNNLAAGVTQVYTNLDGIVYLHCIFGDPYYSSGGHITEVTITRQSSDYFWIGTMITTFNQ